MDKNQACRPAHRVAFETDDFSRLQRRRLRSKGKGMGRKSRDRAVFEHDAIDLPTRRYQVMSELAIEGQAGGNCRYCSHGLGCGRRAVGSASRYKTQKED
jgi:hypothetical protein